MFQKSSDFHPHIAGYDVLAQIRRFIHGTTTVFQQWILDSIVTVLRTGNACEPLLFVMEGGGCVFVRICEKSSSKHFEELQVLYIDV